MTERSAGLARRPRVTLVVHDIKPPGGMERVYVELIRRAAEDIDFTAVSCSLAAELRGLVEWRPVRVLRRPTWLKFALFYCKAAIAVSRVPADLVHTVGAIVPNRVDLATVHFCHAAFQERTGGVGPAARPIARRLNGAIATRLSLLAERWSYRRGRARMLAADSAGVRRELDRYYPDLPVEITPNGVDLGRFAPNPGARSALRQREGVHEDEVVALFVGGDWHHKGLAIAIGALAEAVDASRPRILLWVVGRGDTNRFAALASSAGVSDRVWFFGRVPEQAPYYQAADVFFFPTLYEGFPLVGLEAAASGLPLLTPRVSGLEELVGDNEAGLLVERTPSAMGAGLARLAADVSLRRRLGRVARQRAGAYSWERSAATVLDLYGRLLPTSAKLASVRR